MHHGQAVPCHFSDQSPGTNRELVKVYPLATAVLSRTLVTLQSSCQLQFPPALAVKLAAQSEKEYSLVTKNLDISLN